MFLLTAFCVRAQIDTNYLKLLYDRCIDFDEDKRDSILYYAILIDNESERLEFVKGDVLSLRLKGYHAELANNYEDALSYHLQALTEARRMNLLEYEISALSDIAIVYSAIKEPHEAKKYYLQSASLVKQKGDLGSLVSTYINLGVIYTQLYMYDSATYVLNEALRLGKPHEDEFDLSSLYNNLGNLYFKKQEFETALRYFRDNYRKHQEESNISGFWVDNLNIADVFTEQGLYDSALIYASKALRLSVQLDSKSKEADSYALLAKLEEARGDYKQAHGYLKKWYSLDTAVVNTDMYRTIAGLQEKFNAREREVQNKLLQFEVDEHRLRSKSLTMLVLGVAIAAVLAFVAYVTKRNANKRLSTINDMITRQNQKLAELNYEKNSLIGIVSHDLSTPFATIQMWGQVLQSANGQLNEEQQKAVGRIIQASKYGDNLINRILDVEKNELVNHRINLRSFDLVAKTRELVENFSVHAAKKNIRLQFEFSLPVIPVLSDEQLVERIVTNLLSNAIKYTHSGKNVCVQVRDGGEAVFIQVRDEGVGISASEMPFLFSKYSTLSGRPTDGEHSTGLGLSIVKRIVEDLNGEIRCESEPGKGSEFTVVLKK